jgi:hypothetical protein
MLNEKQLLDEKQLVAILGATATAAMNSFVKAVDDITSGGDPDQMIQEAKANLAFISGRLGKATDLFSTSTQQLDGGFDRLKAVINAVLSFMPEPEQA